MKNFLKKHFKISENEENEFFNPGSDIILPRVKIESNPFKYTIVNERMTNNDVSSTNQMNDSKVSNNFDSSCTSISFITDALDLSSG